MHDIKFIEENIDFVRANLSTRNFDVTIIEQVIELNSKRKELTLQVETVRGEINKTSRQVGELKKKGENADSLMQKVAEMKKEIADGEMRLEVFKSELGNMLATIPNILAKDVPTGSSEQDNKEAIKGGKIRELGFTPKDHVELGEKLGMLDFEAGAKISGARFVVYKGALARLERCLINFMIDQHTANGYLEILPPFIVNASSLFGTGQLPKFKEDLFRLDLPDRDWYLIPTAEVPVTNLKRDELFSADEFPLKYVSYTPCFRSEAGSYGKDTRGLIRLHQFNKVELVNIVAAEESEKAHDQMIERAVSILKLLELPYRGMLLCSGDIGFSARKCIDLEVWLPSQKTFREISSISNCGDFQARRANIRYRGSDGRPKFAHTLNGSGLAVGRTLVAILENYQCEDGSIEIPKVLRPYLGGLERITKI